MTVLKVAALAAVVAVAVVRASAPEYPCSPGWHQAGAPITAMIGACADTSTRRGCVQVHGQPPPHPEQFVLPSCVRDSR